MYMNSVHGGKGCLLPTLLLPCHNNMSKNEWEWGRFVRSYNEIGWTGMNVLCLYVYINGHKRING